MKASLARIVTEREAVAWSKVMFIAGYKDGLAMIAKYKLVDFEVVWVDDKNELHMTSAIEKQLQLKKQPTAGP